jgi:hypothetical protein
LNIFLSYASEQRDTAEAVHLGLQGAGHAVFFDRDALPASGNYLARIAREIGRADLLVFLVSPQSVAAGRYTLSELDVARRRWPHPQGRVLPVMVAPTPMASVPAYLRAVTVLEPRGNLVADVVHAVQFDMPQAQQERQDAAGPATGPAARGRPAWGRVIAAALSLPVLVFGLGLLLVRLDVLHAESLNYLPPLSLVAGLLAALWAFGRRG